MSDETGCRHGLILEACDTCRLGIATAENERLKRAAATWDDERLRLKRDLAMGVVERRKLEGENERLKRTLVRAIVDLSDCSVILGKMNYPDTSRMTAEHVEAYRRALASTTPPAEPAAAPPVALRPAREVAHEFEASYEDCPGQQPRNGHSDSCDRLTALLEADRAAQPRGEKL